eukprot:scaffold72276_cov69-Phaeocystis_antarctica.AAC.2
MPGDSPTSAWSSSTVCSASAYVASSVRPALPEPESTVAVSDACVDSGVALGTSSDRGAAAISTQQRGDGRGDDQRESEQHD